MSSESPMVFSSQSPMIMSSDVPSIPKCNFTLFENQKQYHHPDPKKIEHYKKLFNGNIEIGLSVGVILSIVSLIRIYTSFTKKQQTKTPVSPPLPTTTPQQSSAVKIFKLLLSPYVHLVIGVVLIAVFSQKIVQQKKFYAEFKEEVKKYPICTP